MGAFKDRTGEVSYNKAGYKMTLIKYRTAADIDVQFDDGVVVKHRQYAAFLVGKIKYPSEVSYTERLIGQSMVANNGMKMTIIAAKSPDDIDVQFADGTIVTNKAYGSFVKGQIRNPSIQHANGLLRMDTQISDRIGKVTKACNGQAMTIVAYRGANDIDVKFEDGVIVQHASYNCFKRGEIRNPEFWAMQRAKLMNKWYPTNSGVSVKIIGYRWSKDVDIEFETGEIRHHVYFDGIRYGTIKPKFPYKCDDMIIEKPAYIFANMGNFYCRCAKCGIADIMTIAEIKSHKCIAK